MSKKWKFGRMMDTGITYLILTAVAFVFFFPVSLADPGIVFKIGNHLFI